MNNNNRLQIQIQYDICFVSLTFAILQKKKRLVLNCHLVIVFEIQIYFLNLMFFTAVFMKKTAVGNPMNFF